MEKITFIKACLITVFLTLIPISGLAQSQTFASSGTFTVPAGVTSVTVQAWGGGGRGSTLSVNTLGGGGGGGAFAQKQLTVTPGGTYTVNVGLGSNSSSAAGDSWFGSTTTVLAKGGSSASANSATGAAGGSATLSIGDIKYSGGNGASSNWTYSGGGGSSAGTTLAGTTGTPPYGGNAPAGGGHGGDGSYYNVDGYDGYIPGGGGGGARKTGGSNKIGGTGANGRIVVSWQIAEISVSGNSVAIADGDATVSTLDNTDFGSIDYTSGTITKNFTVTNHGTATLNISGISITGSEAADFTITSAAVTSLAPGASSTITVVFNPSAAGIRIAQIGISSDDYDESFYNFKISGVGTDAEINLIGNSNSIANNDLSPSATDFTNYGNADIAAGTIIRTFTIQNTSAATRALSVGSVTISGANAGDFTVTASPSSPVAVNGTTTFSITFNPSALGLRNAIVTIANDDSDENPYVFAISGTGVDVEITVRGNGVEILDGDTTAATADHTDFGSMYIVTGTVARTFTITNSASATSALSIGAITISGAAASDYSITSLPASSVAIGGSTTFTVTFDPSVTGIRAATISIANNDANENPYDFALTGRGTDPEIFIQGNSVGIDDNDLIPTTGDGSDFGSTHVSGGTVVRTFTIYNQGTATMPLTIGAITFTGTNAADFSVTTLPATTLAVNTSTTFQVTFNPSATGTRSAMINIASNDSNENPYNFAIQGFGADPEMNVVGNLISIVDGDLTPSVSDNTDFGSTSVDSGSTMVTYTVQNTGVGALTLGAISFSGADASNFSIVTPPAASVAAGASTSFVVAFAPTTTGAKSAVISIANDDANENPYNFAIGGLGVRTYADTDGDGVSDNSDIDDDNDGIIDTLEQTGCMVSPFANSVTYTFLNETFGAGTTKGTINVNIPGATCTYCFEDGIAGPNTTACPSQSSWILDDGEYVVTHKIAGTTSSDPDNIHGDLAWNGPVDHTIGDTNGRMAVFNASYTPGIFYETTITGIIPNVPITYSFWALNIMSTGNYNGSILPNITVEFLTTGGTVLSTYNTGNIGRCSSNTADNSCALSNWLQYTTSVNLGNNTTFIIRFKNNAPGGGGNDLALDDITIKQQYCDRDSDGVANIFDLDSDNDGIPDIEEAGLRNLSGQRAFMDLTAGVWLDANANGLHDTIDAMIAGGTYNLPDTDGDGTPNTLDLDSDNDAIFDIDEAGLYNGDGDIDGDGVGDGLETDRDGILDVHDTLAGYGTAVRPYAQDSDNNGISDYMQIDSDSNGSYDIASTLYNSFDANLNGVIDGATDADKDGITDAFDSATAALGSPRNINQKLFLDFDGRNDFAESTQMLGGLSKSTIMGWIKLSDSFASTGFVMGQENFNLKVSTASGNKLTATANGQTITFGTNLAADRWYHIAAVYDGSDSSAKLKLYVNGVPEISSNAGALGGSLQASTAKFTLGKNATASSEYFNGSIDEARVFNTALTADQLQKMVYQEIRQNGAAIRGEVIPKDIESSLWSNLIGYYRMDAYKGDVIDNYVTSAIDEGTATTFARIYNVKTIKHQLAPMPFVTTQSSSIDTAVSQNNFVNGMDVMLYDWSILNIRHNITFSYNNTDLGLIIDPSATVIFNNDSALRNTWYLKLDGKVDLQGRSQLVQTASSDLDVTSAGSIERDQQGTSNKWNYNYWSAPVSAVNTASNNAAFTLNNVFKDGTNPANPQNITWTTGLNGSATAPVTLSSYWIFKFQNVSNSYANWASVGANGSLVPGQGFTLKGSNAATPTQNYVFTGKPNSGNITTTVAPNNLNLSGNPYASALDADAFLIANASAITGTLYFWEHFSTNNTHTLSDYQGGYAVRTLVGGTPPVSPTGVSGLGSSNKVPGRFIPVGQGFFITGSTTGGTITFDNAQRAFIREDNASSNTMFKNGTTQTPDPILNNNEDAFEPDTYARIRIGFNSANNYHRQILLGFMDDKANEAINPGYDAIHIDSQPNDMYFVRSGSLLNIQGVGYFNENLIYNIGVKTSAQGVVKFQIDSTENFDPSQDVFIFDNETGLYHDIRNQAFEILLPSGTINNRFSLRFTNPTQLGTIHPTLENGIEIAFTDANSTINVRNNVLDAEVQNVALFNVLGQQIATWNVESMDQHNIALKVNSISIGTYIVKITTSKGDVSRKIAVK